MTSNSIMPLTLNHSLKILSLDDDPVIEHVLRELFSGEYRHRHSFSVNGFLELFESFQPDIVLVDLNLPDGNGISVCKKIKSSNIKEMPYILIMTTETDEETVKNAYDAGIDDYIRKPFFPFEIITKIRIITENIVSKTRLKELYSGMKSFNQKLYRLTRVINKNINEITKSDIMSSMRDVVKLISFSYCEVILFENPSHQQFRISDIDNSIPLTYERLVKLNPSILQSDMNHETVKIRSKNRLMHIHIFKIFFNNEKSGFVIIESLQPVPKESLDLIKLYLDFINMKGTDIELRNRLKQEIEKERKEIAKVRTIQVSLLPDFKDIPGFEISSSFIPMDEISGDFYDGFYINDHTYQFVVCDVCGHGMASSFVGSAIRSIIRTISQDLESLEDIVGTLNGILTQTTIDIAYFATLFVWQIDYKNCKMKYLSAGHPEALLYSSESGEIVSLNSTGSLVGIFPETVYKEGEIPFNEGDILFVYTDGLTEATEPVNNEMFKIERLKEHFKDAVQKNTHTIDIIHTILGAVYSFIDYNVVEDDVTIICVKKDSPCTKGP